MAKKKFWNINFILLWQGQLVSAVGDYVYEIALGFWVLGMTGSTGMMGTLMFTSAIPRIVVGPFAGVVVDRVSRKLLMVGADVIRGVSILLIAALAFTGHLQVWMLFVVGVLLGICSAFFNPAVHAVMPDLVPEEKVVQANSAFAVIYSFSNVFGNASGGFIYQLLGAPVLFFINSISYLISGVSELFIAVPHHENEVVHNNFVHDLSDGFHYIVKSKELLGVFIFLSVLNFFSAMWYLLEIPLFEQNELLGVVNYGFVMAANGLGMVAGYTIISTITIQSSYRFSIFISCGLLELVCFTIFPHLTYIPIMALLMFLSGFSWSFIQSFIMSGIQIFTPAEKRGRVIAFFHTVIAGFAAVAMFAGGMLAEFFPTVWIMSIAGALPVFGYCFFLFDSRIKLFLNFNAPTE